MSPSVMIIRSQTSQMGTMLASMRIFKADRPSGCHFNPRSSTRQELLSDSGLKDLLQKIIECRPPDEHAMGAAWQDCVGMLDVCLLKLVLEFCYVLSDDFIVSACSDVEKDQSLIYFFSVR